MFLVAPIAGCSLFSPSNSADNVEFGDAYEIRTTNPSTGDATPPAILVGERVLGVTVSYSGGCEEHDFTVHSMTESDGISLWLEHDAHGDACDSLVTEELQRGVSDQVASAATVQMLNPNGNPIAVVRIE